MNVLFFSDFSTSAMDLCVSEIIALCVCVCVCVCQRGHDRWISLLWVQCSVSHIKNECVCGSVSQRYQLFTDHSRKGVGGQSLD